MLFVKDDLMRVQHWITAILSAVLLLPSSKAVFAQGGPGYSQQPGGWSTIPGPFPQAVSYGPAYETWPTSHEPGLLPHHQSSFVPSFSPLNMNPQGQAGYQPEMLPWPNVSQFHGPSYSELHHTQGLWHFDSSSGGKRYFGSVEYIRGRFKKADGVVGQPGAARYKDYALPVISVDLGEADLADAFQGDAPNSDFLLDGDGDQIGFFPPVGEPGYNYYDRTTARETGHPKSNGIRVRWGFLDSDERGVIIDGWWTGKGESEMIGENGAARSLTQPGLLFRSIDSQNGFLEALSPFTHEEVLRSNLLNLRGLPVNDGTLEQLQDGRYIGGTTIPYDLEFNLKFKSQAAGTSVNVLMMPIVKKKNIKVRPIVGARYLYVKEEFNFFGHDSGLAYDNQDLGDIIFPRLKMHSLPDNIDGDGNGVIDDPGGFEDPDPTAGQQQAIDQGRFLRLDLIAETILGVEHPGRYQAFIDNVAVSHMIGPEVGLQYDIGGDRVKLRGHSKFALLANFEKMNLKGDNVGDANNIADSIDITDPLNPVTVNLQDSPLITPTGANPNPNAFKDDLDNSHVSPMFEQSVFLDLPVFDHVPYLKRVAAFDEAKLTFGWTFTFVAEVLRPSESIIYNANPRAGLFPSLESKRGNWWTSNWSVGVEIPY